MLRITTQQASSEQPSPRTLGHFYALLLPPLEPYTVHTLRFYALYTSMRCTVLRAARFYTPHADSNAAPSTRRVVLRKPARRFICITLYYHSSADTVTATSKRSVIILLARHYLRARGVALERVHVMYRRRLDRSYGRIPLISNMFQKRTLLAIYGFLDSRNMIFLAFSDDHTCLL